MTGKGDGGLPTPLPARIKFVAFAVAMPWAALTVFVYLLALSGGFVKVWGRDWTPTLSHFRPRLLGGDGRRKDCSGPAAPGARCSRR